MTDFPEEGLVATLDNSIRVQVAALGTKTYPVRLPKDKTPPAITYQSFGAEHDITRDGPSGLVIGMFQVTCWADGDPTRSPGGYLQCLHLAQAVRQELNGKVHLWDQVDAIPMLSGQMDRFEPESQTYMRVLDFQITHREDVG